MKKSAIALAILSLVLCSCGEESITVTDTPIATGGASSIGPDDIINEADFNRTVTITWSGSSATVSGDTEGFVSINGSRVTVDSRSDTTKVVKYILTGSSTDGSFKLYSLRKQALVLSDLTLSNSGGAAINNQSGKRTFVVLEGTSSLADGPVNASGDYPDAVEDEDLKAAFFSEGQLVFSGSGTLSVTSQGKAGITSDDYLRFLGTHAVNVKSTSGHALRGKDAVQIEDGTFTLSTTAAGKKGISSEGDVSILGGELSISVSGGVLSETSTTGTELSSAAGIKAGGTFTMSGGAVSITSSGQGGKGISGDGAGIFSGGTLDVTVTGANYGSSSGGFGGGGGGFGGRPGGPGSSSSTSSKGAKGIKFDGDITMSGGTVNVTAQSHEAFESKGAMTVSGGSLYAYSAGDDAINRGGSDTTTDMTLSGGFVCGWSAGNDGIDSNGNLYIQGATVYAVCTKGSPEVAVDANSEARKALYVKSGTLVSIGGLESGSSLTGSAYSTSSWAKSSMHVLCDSSGSPALAFKTPASSSNGTMVLYCGGSALTLESGVTVDDGTLLWNGNGYEAPVFSGGSQVSLSSYSGSGGGGMFR